MSRGGARRKKEAPDRAPTYWKRAGRFARAAAQNGDAGHWDPCVANAINAVINLTDALCVHFIGERSAGEAHHEALAVVSGLVEVDGEVRRAIDRHLRALLSLKNLAQYEGRLLEEADARAALQHLDRVAKSVRPLAKDLGWPLREGP